jgi:hypothetical protein
VKFDQLDAGFKAARLLMPSLQIVDMALGGEPAFMRDPFKSPPSALKLGDDVVPVHAQSMVQTGEPVKRRKFEKVLDGKFGGAYS